jgi:hypothetical protein
MNENYMQVIPDSQYFTTLEQIESYAISRGNKYLEIAIRNTIKNGYKLIKVEDEREVERDA